MEERSSGSMVRKLALGVGLALAAGLMLTSRTRVRAERRSPGVNEEGERYMSRADVRRMRDNFAAHQAGSRMRARLGG